ncbi:MAG: MarR family winged helix-turn-helix transcriptional regulator [Rubrobacteraceae bacterium]
MTTFKEAPAVTRAVLQERMIGLIRAFGLHRPDETPCGQPVAVAEAHALMELARGEPLLQKELAARLRLEKSTVSRLAGAMERRGWVERVRCPEDGRALELRLTGTGRKVAADISEARRVKFARIFDEVPEQKRVSVIEALNVLEEAMTDER